MKPRLGTVFSWIAQPVAWGLWVVTLGRFDKRNCAECARRKAEWDKKFPNLFR